MTLIDLNDNRRYTTHDLWKEWKALRKEEPWNHADSFRIEMLEILTATFKGRNDMEILDTPPREARRIIRRLQANL